MVSFASALQPEDPEALRAYLVSKAIEAKKTPPLPGAAPPPAQPRTHAQ
jgi:hypothetical protein